MESETLTLKNKEQDSIAQILEYCCKRFCPEASIDSLSITPIYNQQRYRLVFYDWIEHSQVQLVELYRHVGTGRKYTRIYLHAMPTWVPSLVIGTIQDLSPIAKRTQSTLVNFEPRNGMAVLVETPFKALIRLPYFPLWEEVVNTQQNLFYLVRPSSFILHSVSYYKLVNDQSVKIKYYIDKLSEHSKFFMRITRNSQFTYWEEHECYGFVLTNCLNYMNRHHASGTWQNLAHWYQSTPIASLSSTQKDNTTHA